MKSGILKIIGIIRTGFKYLYYLANDYIWIFGYAASILVGISSYYQVPLGLQTSTNYNSLMFSRSVGLSILIAVGISLIGGLVALVYRIVKWLKVKKDKSLQERIGEIEAEAKIGK